MKSLSFTWRRLAFFLVIFLLAFAFIPTLRCERDVEVAGKICSAIGYCSTDLYVSFLIYLFSSCSVRVKGAFFGAYIVVMLIASYLIACALDHIYSVFIDI